MKETRRRGVTLEAAILHAGWEQLIDKGYSGFTYESIAERAKTGKAVLYRRWPDKEELLLAVLTHQGFTTPAEVPDTGSLREDVLTLLRSANRRGGRTPALFSTLLSAYFNETKTTPAQLRTQLFGDQSGSLTQVVQHAINRGDLPSEGLPPRIVKLPSDLLRHELLMNLSEVPDETIVDIVDTIFLPLATDPRRRQDRLGQENLEERPLNDLVRRSDEEGPDERTGEIPSVTDHHSGGRSPTADPH